MLRHIRCGLERRHEFRLIYNSCGRPRPAPEGGGLLIADEVTLASM